MSSIHAHARDFSLTGDGLWRSIRSTALTAAAIAFALTLAALASPLFTARTAETPAVAISIYGP